jgi:hypothetical protein
VEVKCSGTDVGSVGPGNLSRTTEIPLTSIRCEAGKNCEELLKEKKARPLGLPWNSELKETEGVIRGTLRATTNGKPGWEAECKVLGLTKDNVCRSEEGLVTLSNNNTPGTVGPLLVLADFLHPNKPEAECTTGTGDVLGGISILLANGDGLRVSK